MIAIGKEMALKNGPSREELFDKLKHAPTNKELKVTEFWGEERDAESITGFSLPIEIEGVHSAGDCGREWFFWGKLKQITSGDKWVPMWVAKDVCFVFGRWNTYHRRGRITFGNTSFFTSTLSTE